ncbi:two-component system sensor histidine kinase NtrB [Rhodoferax sediminis]|uniref:histidine kinase n=1 Tax=Rhodoferax sediminis TaxID=2509614 RepID=A0A515D6C6_9BURK|nr:PAS domain S-box protein [Rhodoferax sediminis]QDL35976.1 PAS domain S-box protein [Rhodoferax sediminis]
MRASLRPALDKLALAWRRWSLWALLAGLVLAVLATLVFLAGRYEASQVQAKLERDTANTIGDIRAGLARNVQSLQALQAGRPAPEAWALGARALLHERRELMRIEWRDDALAILEHVDSPFHVPVFSRYDRSIAQSDMALACANAHRFSGPAYSNSYFVPQSDGLGMEMMDVCLPLASGGQPAGYLVATYSLQEILSDLVEKQLTRSQEVSFTEADGTRLALHGQGRRGSRVFTAQQLLNLPGYTLVLRMDSWRAAPDLFPDVLTALVSVMSIALVSVLVLLAKDMRRRLRAERGLADALAFRKAMEDSLVTGLRARDLQGRITYVNPAFCQMVGFAPEELMGHSVPAPYWPPDQADEYRQRHAIRMSGGSVPPREGFESVFVRKDGTRFPVLIIEAPLIDAQGVQTGWMGACLDISEQRRVQELTRATQERLQATARLATVGEMASLLSHELNQPLAAISSYATGSMNLLQGDPGPDGHSSLALAMRRIAEQAGRAGRIIKSVHDFVRRRDEAREVVRPQDLFDAILPLVSLQAGKLGVRVELSFEKDLPSVLCDHTMVEQVLLNLARNAMQAMDEPAITRRLLVLAVRRAQATERTAHSPGWLEFSVADLGPGIAPQVAQQLFTPFFTTKREGMGLGLSLCRTVVEQHGGFLTLQPNQPQGMIFRFTLPVHSPAATAADA